MKLKMEAIDKIDRQILRILQADGRASFEQIAETVGHYDAVDDRNEGARWTADLNARAAERRDD